MIRAKDLFSWPDSLPFAEYFDLEAFPWEWLGEIRDVLERFDYNQNQSKQDLGPNVQIGDKVYLDPSVKILGPCVIQGPAFIGPEVEIRPNAFIRSDVIVGKGSVLGNSCEYKNCILMENVETAHFNYVGDSILGNGAHLGAGVICANLRLARDEVIIRVEGERFKTGRRKVGAFLGDNAEVGCNSVLQPGTILGKDSAVISMPFQGYLPAGKMALPDFKKRVIRRPGF